VSFVLTATGLLLLAASLVGVALGLYMAADRRTRARGLLFAVWWVPGLAAASGVLMRDVVTFTVGMLCFVVAGTVFLLQSDRPRESPVNRKGDPAGGPQGAEPPDSEKPTKKNRAGSSGRAYL
jgi:hypothetical protein